MQRNMLFVAVAAVLSAAGCGPTASFTVDDTGGEQPLTVQFTDTSATLLPLRISLDELFPVYEWEWEFGDGGGSLEQNPDYTYVIAGDYTVSLTVRNTFGTDTVTRENLISVRAPTSGPTAAFSLSIAPGDGFTVNFSDESEAGTRPITDWLWDFGDGNSSTERNPTHTYAEAGTYDVFLQVTTVVGTDSAEQSVTVPAVFPTAAFTFEANDDTGLNLKFRDASDPGSAEEIATYLYDFGDGETINVPNPSHVYEEAGDYDVTLTVTTEVGEDSSTQTITVPLETGS